MGLRKFIQQPLAALLCASLLLSIFSLPVQADDGPRIVIEIGQPGVWSLGQAHYLLERAELAKQNRVGREADDVLLRIQKVREEVAARRANLDAAAGLGTYGKGDDKFGWTYGPQPGTKRIMPGEKTTFAVLVVPRNTLAVELKAGIPNITVTTPEKTTAINFFDLEINHRRPYSKALLPRSRSW